MRFLKLLPLALLPLAAQAQSSSAVPVSDSSAKTPWSVTLRSTYLVTTDGSTAGGPLNLPKDAISIEDKLIPEFDIGYQINDHWAFELVLTIPQEHDVKLNGGEIGDFKHLPPTLMVKYMPGEWAGFTPYVGAGVNFTLIFDENLPSGLKLDTYSIGPAVQVGVDYALSDTWSLNFDVKRVMLRTDVSTGGGTELSRLDLDPWLFAIGVRRAF